MTLDTRAGTVAGTLAQFVAGLTLDDVPTATVERLKLHVLDALGCAIFGRSLEHSESLIEVLGVPGPGGGAVVGGGVDIDPYNAALVNGALVSSFELDDVGVYVHPSACIVPAALGATGLAGGHATTGARFLEAVVAGYELTVRISEVVGFDAEKVTGWHTPGFHGAIGAAATAAKVLGLDADRTAHAIAMAADLAGGGLIHARFGSDVKRLHTGRGAYTGLTSAVLAKAGHQGLLDVFEDPRWGYVRALTLARSDGGVDTDPSRIVDGLGHTFDAVDRIAIKYYPITAKGMAVVDGVNAIMRSNGLTPDDVREVRIGLAHFGADQAATVRPASGLRQVNFSYPYAAAMAVCRPCLPLTESAQVLTDWLHGVDDEKVADVQRRVTVGRDEGIESRNAYSMDAHIEITDRTGAALTVESGYGRSTDTPGSIRFRSLERADVVQKFHHMVQAGRSDVDPGAVEVAVLALDGEVDLSSLFVALGMAGDKPRTETRSL